MNRRKFMATGAVAGLSAAIAKVRTASAATTINVWSHIVPGKGTVRERAIAYVVEAFEASNPGVTVKFNMMPWEQIGPTLLRASKAGQVPDVASIYSSTVPQLVAAEALNPLEPFLRAWPGDARRDLVRLKQSEDSGGNVFALPYQLIVSGLTYRADLLEQAGTAAPRTLSEWSETAAALSKNGMIGISLGFNPRGAPIPAGWFLSTLLGLGAKVVNENGKAAFDSPEARSVLQWIRDQVYERKTIPADVALMDQEQTQDLFIAKRAVFLPSSTQRFFVIRDKGAFGTNLKMTAYPTTDPSKPGPAVVQAWNLTIPRGAKNSELAWKFIEHWTSKEMQVAQTRIAGLVPMRNSALTDPIFNDPNTDAVKWAVQYATSAPMNFDFPTNTEEMYDVWMKMIGQVITTKVDLAQALTTAEQEYDRRTRR